MNVDCDMQPTNFQLSANGSFLPACATLQTSLSIPLFLKKNISS